ncbi:MAG: hypothetical protein R2860_12220 [Desulfobacterales bacterium]
MNILVTGASGYIGGKTGQSPRQKKVVNTVVGTDIREPAYKHPKYIFEMRDIRKPMDDIFEKPAD